MRIMSPAHGTLLRMTEPPAPPPAAVKRRMALVLTELRERSGLSQQQAAEAVELSKSSLSRYESGATAPKFHAMKALLALYGADQDLTAQMEDLARQASRRGWKAAMFGEGATFPEWLTTYVGLEATASSLSIYDLIIPGLFQTPEYAREVIAAGGHTEAEIERGVRLRTARQVLLTDSKRITPTVHAILDEGAIHRQVGSPDVMREQMRRLASLARRPHLTIQIVPFTRGSVTAAIGGGSVVLGLDPDPPIVYLESHEIGHYIEAPEQVERYTLAFKHVAEQAMSATATLRILTEASKGE